MRLDDFSQNVKKEWLMCGAIVIGWICYGTEACLLIHGVVNVGGFVFSLFKDNVDRLKREACAKPRFARTAEDNLLAGDMNLIFMDNEEEAKYFKWLHREADYMEDYCEY
jgi:hypothetical protein